MSDTPREAPLVRHVLAVIAGNALEFYDFLTYSTFAVYIGAAFFPYKDDVSSLLASLAAFGAGFSTRPIGGIVIGMMGDRWGRKPAMYLSFTLMGVGILGVSLTPSYAAIGIAAPILLILFRLIQGFALGGEVGPTTAFLIEAPPPETRGFYGSLQSASQYVATFITGIIASALAFVMPADILSVWGWRAAFFAGALIIPFGLMIRRSLPETMHAASWDEPARWRDHMPVALLGLAMMGGMTIATYVLLSLATYAKTVLHLEPSWAFAATLGVGAGGMFGAPAGGLLSDRVGRKPVLIGANAALLLSTLPVFYALNALASGPATVAAAFYMTFILAMNAGVGIMTLAELLPPSIRSGAMSTLYAVAIAVFGGSAQYVVYALKDWLHDPMAPAYYMTAALLVSLTATACLRESAPGFAR